MAGKIKIDTERCKGCGLCVLVCPKGGIIISGKSNKKGYFPAEIKNPPAAECTGCGLCAVICPDAAIEVFREDNVAVVEAAGKKRKSSILQRQDSKK
jgi:2-oxoglutarate ferredoxin oxidoreductase subunit delta